MKFVADFHIHSKYSRATSKDMDLEHLDKWAKIKGINVLGTGDFTHPEWLKHLKENLTQAESGLFKLKDSDGGTRFILTAEISCIYSKKNRVRKIHIIIFAPSFEVVEKINAQLGWIGNLKSDGRPILGLDAKELAKIALNASQECLIVPAHCLLPDSVIHTKDDLLKKIKDIKVGDLVFTHQNRWRKVKEIFKRRYKGKVYSIKPYYFREGLTTTPEHPFYIIKTKKNCHWSGGICKPSHKDNPDCKKKYYNFYKPIWVSAQNLEKGDVLIFPRFKNAFNDHSSIVIEKLLNNSSFKKENVWLRPKGSRFNCIRNIIPINKEFCRLVGYYLAEGYSNGRDAIGFTFNTSEKQFINDVIDLVRGIFGFNGKIRIRDLPSRGKEIVFYSKILQNIFTKLCYRSVPFNAGSKCLPDWMLDLSEELQVEILKGWWRGDKGYTSSRLLMNQIKIILLRLGIIPSIYKEDQEAHHKRGNHYFGKREIKANYDCYAITRLSFFEDKFNLLASAEFKQFRSKSTVKHGWIDDNYIYLPIHNIEINKYKGEVYNLEVEEDNSYLSEFATVHNCWTPWFALFGSKSGFDSIEECFEDYSKYIYALETGLSSDPGMNWRLSALDKVAFISNSDSHSPARIGREANVFDTELSYPAIIDAIKTKNPQKFLSTVEFYPEEGKYHFDGHRNCAVCLSPKETKKYNGICPVCGKPLTIGVLSRVEELADRPEGFKLEGAVPFRSLVPLEEIIADAVGRNRGTKEVDRIYKSLIEKFGSEFKILLEVSKEELSEAALREVGEGIIRVREGRVAKEPGYDGVYGKIKIFSKENKKEFIKQDTLF